MIDEQDADALIAQLTQERCELFRFRLVPRVLAVFGMVTSLLQIIGVPLRVLVGYPAEMRMAMTLAPAYLALAVWLLIKGFDEG